MTKNNAEFQRFLRQEVNLNRDRLDRLNTSVRAVNQHLKSNLTGYQSMEPQGSYALSTLIKPVNVNGEYDADIQIVMNPNSRWQPRDYINAIHDALSENQTYANKVKVGTRCVTIDYARDFHLDVVPRTTINGTHRICNRLENKFETTDGPGYREWFFRQNRITRPSNATGGNLVRVVKLLKYIRDRQSNYAAKSILLTTLAGNAISQTDEGTESVRTVADTLVTVLCRMDEYLQRHSVMPQIQNPAMPSETFNRHWDQNRYAYFRERIHTHAGVAKDALATPSSRDAVRLWRRLFGNNFGSG